MAKTMHCLPVFTTDGESGSLVYYRRVPKKIQEALLEALPDTDNSWSIESDLGVFLPEEEREQGLDVLEEVLKDVEWCDGCLEGHPCDAWKIDFEESSFIPRNPSATKPSGKFNLKSWIEEKRKEYEEYRETANDIMNMLNDFVKSQQHVVATSVMSKRQAASILEVTLPCEAEMIKKAFKAAAIKAHPDKGGSEEAMKKVIQARDILLPS